MSRPLVHLALVIALTCSADLARAGELPPAPRRPPDLAIHPWSEPHGVSLEVGGRAEAAATPPCLGDVCQPRVSVPGLSAPILRPSRSELAAVYLERAHVEPLATVAWILLASGLRLDYGPPELQGPSQAPSRWGTLFVRLKLRVDADNLPVIPHRHR